MTPARVPPMASAYDSATVLGAAGGVLLDGDQRRHAAALGVGAAHEVAGALRGDHDHVDALGRGDAAEADVEAVGEGERVARLQAGGDVLVVDRLLLGVGGEDHHDVGGRGGLGDRQHLEALRLGLGDRRRALAEPDDHVDARVLQVEGVGVALRAVADDGDRLAAG